MSKPKKLAIPKGKYIGQIEVNADTVTVDFKKKQKVALLFICLNERYWPYIIQVIKDCKEKFLPHHKVDIFLWSDLHKYEEIYKTLLKQIADVEESSKILPLDLKLKAITDVLIPIIGRHVLYPTTALVLKRLDTEGIQFKMEKDKMWLETQRLVGDWMAELLIGACKEVINFARNDIEYVKRTCTIEETEPMEWPIPTLMRYHLFLNKEEKLKNYEQIFYLDADMRVVQKVSDEILSDGLTAAPHPGYAVAPRMIPPYEPNNESEAYIQRLGFLRDEGGKKRFIPFYAAGGFQGGNSKEFLKAMKVMKTKIDNDFNKNYTAIWNDESHWNRYLWEYQRKGGHIVFLDVSYVYPDSLIKEYYVPLWGKEYEPKIITITKPFTMSKQGGDFVKELLGQKSL